MTQTSRIELPGSGVRVPRLIFGTAQLFRSGMEAHRQRLIDAAYDHGLTHFDTAPLYGAGVSERSLAPILARHKDATVTTKVGLYYPGGADQPGPLSPCARPSAASCGSFRAASSTCPCAMRSVRSKAACVAWAGTGSIC